MLVTFDVNGTLSDLDQLRPSFAREELPEAAVDTWFAATLRDGIALTAAGGFARFDDLAAATLEEIVRRHRAGRDVEPVTQRLLSRLRELPTHEDVAPALRRLRDADVVVATLTNGSIDATERLLADADLTDCVDHVLDVNSAEHWKPSRQAYEHALRVVGCTAAEMVLVAAHPWDVAGAMRAGIRGAWVNRIGAHWPAPLDPPDLVAADLVAVVGEIISSR